MCHVLIIEDEPMTAMLIEDILAAHGATSFEIATTEQDAVRCACGNRPAVITSDVNLAEGKGPHAVREIHRRMGDIPVIFITSSPGECDPCDPPGVVLGKPMDEGKVASAFRQFAPA